MTAKPQLREWDAANYLTTPGRQAEYLIAAIEADDGDGKNIARALGVLARACGMVDVAAAAGVHLPSPPNSPSGEEAVSLASAIKIIHQLGFELSARPMTPPVAAE